MADDSDGSKKENTVAVVSKKLRPKSSKRKAVKLSESYNSDEQVNMPKKSGRIANLTSAGETNTNSSLKTIDSLRKRIKKETIEEGEASSERLRSLRNRKRESSLPKEPEPGPSIKEEPPDYGSDHLEYEFDDSDSDPAWTPSSKAGKVADPAKSFIGQLPARKRSSKGHHRRSSSNNPSTKQKRTKSSDLRSKKHCKSKRAAPPEVNKGLKSKAKVKKEIETDQFLVAKADMNLPTPYIWKVDKKSSMLQRFEISEQNGVLLYHSSFTFAARNEISVNNYVRADVRIKSPDTVQYLGPNLSEVAALSISMTKKAAALPKEPPKKKEIENFDHLKDDFTVYIQSLLSQDVDSSFFHEIKNFNDEYFLVPISNLEAISESKKNKLIIDSWNEKLKNCLNTYPCISIVNSFKENANCQVCKINMGSKLLHFFGQPYDAFTLENVDMLVDTESEFDVCDKCSVIVSLYNRLHHHKYNLFNKCRSKANEVKTYNDLMSHEDVLKSCLEDIAWIEKMFVEQTQIWHEIEEKS